MKRKLLIGLLLLGGCTPYTKAATSYQDEMRVRDTLEIGYSQWYRREANKCLDKAALHGQSELYAGKPVTDRVTGIKQIYSVCIKPIDAGVDEVAKIVDEISAYNKEAAQVLLDVAKGVKPRTALLSLPVVLLPKVLRLKIVIENAEKGE